MKIEPLTHEGVLYVASHMRDWDKKEIFATRWTDDPADVAASCVAAGAFSWVASLERPICAIGGAPMWPGVWSMWMFATDEWPIISTSVTKFVRRVMLPKLWAVGAHRLECRAMEGHPSGNWLKFFGAEREGPLVKYGKDQKTFYTYAIIRNS